MTTTKRKAAAIAAVALLAAAALAGWAPRLAATDTKTATEAQGYRAGDTIPLVDGVWDLKVMAVVADADAAIAAAGQPTESTRYRYTPRQSNETPTHRYTLVEVFAVNRTLDYQDVEGLPGKLLGGDNLVYDNEYGIVTPYEASFTYHPRAAPGGTILVQFVFDVPETALDGAVLLLGEDRVQVRL